MEYRNVINNVVFILWITLFFISCEIDNNQLGQNEAIRVYVEFADGTNRGIYNEKTGQGGFPDEDYDATTAMVITWHKFPERDTTFNARLEYRSEYPSNSSW